jgi:nucleoside-diphosphate-sugar epimerase
MRALITGGTGYLGSFLVRRWADQHGVDNVVCLVPPRGNPQEEATRAGFERDGIVCVEGDLRNVPVAAGLEGPWDVVFHLAAATNTSWTEGQLAPINVQGTQNLLNTLSGRLRGKRVVFTSTSAAVDRRRRPCGPLTESSPCHPRTPYGRTKLKAEELLREWCAGEGAEYTITRLTTLYGPGVRTGLVPVLAEGLSAGALSTRINWPGRVSMLFIEDAVRLLLYLSTCPDAANETFFLTSGEALEVTRIAECIAKHLPESPRLVRLPRWLWSLVRTTAWMPLVNRLVPWRLLHILDDGLLCDSSKVQKVYPHPLVRLEEGLARTFARQEDAVPALV